ncbi:MAG: hypothetical protein RR980_03410 [Mucinivorans sp.]
MILSAVSTTITAQESTHYKYCQTIDSLQHVALSYASAYVFTQTDSVNVMVTRPWVTTLKENYIFILRMPQDIVINQSTAGTYCTQNNKRAVEIKKVSPTDFVVVFVNKNDKSDFVLQFSNTSFWYE